MHASFTPPRQVRIGDAALFVGSTPRAIRHYHEIGLLPEPERGGDGRRRYGYEDMIRLLWIRRMADAGIALDDIRDAFTTGTDSGRVTSTGTVSTGTTSDGATSIGTTSIGTTSTGTASVGTTDARTDGGGGVAGILGRLEEALAEQEAELRRQRAAVRRMRTEGSRMGLLSDLVTERLKSLPEGSLRQADLDSLLVTERIFGPLGAAVQATRFIALATHPALRKESDRIEAAEEALDDRVAVDDPRVAQVAVARHAFENALHAVIEESGLDKDDDALFDAWDTLHPPATAEDGEAEAGLSSARGRKADSMNVLEATGKMPYDFSPARLRCMELAEELSTQAPPAAQAPPTVQPAT
ncbi:MULTISPECIES: MerR family transcriptional regulator [unclassified Streptomyces]|uniref:MerR family transcriptional regulator n=1 Tax=unclassified Streptomyces TaxID=2593676 RepID=UPI00136E4108|nr:MULTISPECIES: MerR family transcriptional regulator [unclassified Streptomyces]NEA03445.1 MerR family transcriptional regulator [Streptomyces sp. SID10116]MYY83902.1 MerR family DNA-binding transcriptional regulator [Streptomyces sp. SID335]MYZ18976.1 MerR family DNA-binding transcriptional regulator [Streptomyces sp. SID337]NDZ84104.1 MerR family transcriptional regulator [Streptomyces sp. SID10115]NEA05970.1 MerR family transcriptional regulator [Streptomyces sp. SID10116]